MAASTSVPLSVTSQLSFIQYYKQTQELQSTFRSGLRSRMEAVDKAYQRETDLTIEQRRAKAANKAGNSDRLQNITIPVVAPHVRTAVAYQASVFLTGVPLFGAVAEPKYMDEAVQLESVIDENAIKGGWTKQFLLFFQDGFKYNFAPLEVTWVSEVTPAIETDVQTSISEGKPVEHIWAGNRVKRLDPYNTFVDPRVKPTEVHTKGEFAGYKERMSRIELKQFIAALPDKIITNIKSAFESGIGSSGVTVDSTTGFFVPSVNPEVTNPKESNEGSNWLSWAGLSSLKKDIQYKDSYEVTTLYCRVLPSEFSLAVPKSNTPQIYKLIIINDQHIIYCERQTNAHNLLPIFIGQPLEDGLEYQTKSAATDVVPFQEVASGLMNSIIHSRRRAVTDRLLYDPSRITAAHINSPNSAAKIPVRSAAYGKTISDAVYQFPYREDQASFSMNNIQQVLGLANTLSGQNQASQGQFVKGNKTLHEYEDVMSNANGSDQMVAILLEAQVFTPLKEVLKINILQYQGGTTVYNRDKQIAVEVDPIKLRKAILNFKISDGLVPTEKLINGETFAVALQVIGSSPQIGAAYNIGQLFSYFMKTQGAKITDFEKSAEQQAYEQAANMWQQLATTAIENGIDPEKLPPQPLPADFGYTPAKNKPAPEGEESNSGESPQREAATEATEATPPPASPAI